MAKRKLKLYTANSIFSTEAAELNAIFEFQERETRDGRLKKKSLRLMKNYNILEQIKSHDTTFHILKLSRIRHFIFMSLAIHCVQCTVIIVKTCLFFSVIYTKTFTFKYYDVAIIRICNRTKRFVPYFYSGNILQFHFYI